MKLMLLSRGKSRKIKGGQVEPEASPPKTHIPPERKRELIRNEFLNTRKDRTHHDATFIVVTSDNCPHCVKLKETGNYEKILEVVRNPENFNGRVDNVAAIDIKPDTDIAKLKETLHPQVFTLLRGIPAFGLIRSDKWRDKESNLAESGMAVIFQYGAGEGEIRDNTPESIKNAIEHYINRPPYSVSASEQPKPVVPTVESYLPSESDGTIKLKIDHPLYGPRDLYFKRREPGRKYKTSHKITQK